MKPVFYGGKRKALTFSFDDEVTQDRRLVEIFNKYGMKCTWNLNSGRFSTTGVANGFNKPVTHNKIDASEVAELYKGHEVAVHGVNHPWLQYLDESTIYDEIMRDRENLEELVGYPVTGMAYPFGTYNQMVVDILADCGIKYSRTVESTKAFGYPKNFLEWHPTCHFGDEEVEDLIQQFLNLGHDGGAERYLPIFYVWGHSYELDGNDTWELMEETCKRLSNLEDVWYATNGQLVEYYEALEQLTFSADGSMIKNNSHISIWVDNEGEVIEIKSGELVRL